MRKVLCILFCALFLVASCCSPVSAGSSGNDQETVPAANSGSPADPSPQEDGYNVWMIGRGSQLWTTDGQNVFYIDITDQNRWDIYRIGPGNDDVPVRIASVDAPVPSNPHDGYPAITCLMAAPDKVYYRAFVSETATDDYHKHVYYEMIRMNKDGSDAHPIDLGPADYNLQFVDGTDLYYSVDGGTGLYRFDMVSMQTTPVSIFEPEDNADGYTNLFGIYRGKCYYIWNRDLSDDSTASLIYSVDISSRERKDIFSVECRHGAQPLLFSEGYLFILTETADRYTSEMISVDLSGGNKYTIGQCSALIDPEISVSNGTAYYLADETTVRAVTKTGENSRVLFSDDILTGAEVGFSHLLAAGDWLYYGPMVWLYDSQGNKLGTRVENTINHRIRTDGSSGPVSLIEERR